MTTGPCLCCLLTLAQLPCPTGNVQLHAMIWDVYHKGLAMPQFAAKKFTMEICGQVETSSAVTCASAGGKDLLRVAQP